MIEELPCDLGFPCCPARVSMYIHPANASPLRLRHHCNRPTVRGSIFSGRACCDTRRAGGLLACIHGPSQSLFGEELSHTLKFHSHFVGDLCSCMLLLQLPLLLRLLHGGGLRGRACRRRCGDHQRDLSCVNIPQLQQQRDGRNYANVDARDHLQARINNLRPSSSSRWVDPYSDIITMTPGRNLGQALVASTPHPS